MALFCPAPHPGSTPKVGLLVLGRAGTVWESRLAFAGLSTRRYPVGLEPVGHRVEQTGRSTSKSAVSRRFVAATETALADLLAADLSELDLVALMIDGVHFGEHLCVVALGIGIDGVKHPLGLVEGSTENTTVVTDLLTGLRERGLDRSPSPVSRSVTTVVFSVEPSTSPSGCLTPSMPIPSAATHRCSPKWTPSIINATRSSPDRSTASRSANAVSVAATNLRETADLSLIHISEPTF